MLAMCSEKNQDRSQLWEPGVQNGLKCSRHRTDQGRENVGEPNHGINVEPGVMCVFLRLHLKVSSSESYPKSAPLRQRLCLLHSFATGS